MYESDTEPEENLLDDELGEDGEVTPEDDDLWTDDCVTFYVVGKRGLAFRVNEQEDYRHAVKWYQHKTRWYGNVWYQSDHGNLSLLNCSEDVR
jgi:hypothetical protein